MRLIDTHQHLILCDRLSYSWAETIPALAGRSFTLNDYAELTCDKGLIGTVFMETAVDDVDFKEEARLVAGFVKSGAVLGQIASCRPEDENGFDAWLEELPELGVVGLRRILHVVDDGLSQTETFRRNLRKLRRTGLPFDLCVFARQHPIALDLIRACPDQVFVLDHFGNPDIAHDGFEPWFQTMRQLAQNPQIYVKFSGITVNARPDQVNVPVLQPYVNALIDLFGVGRIVWGGDWPVCNLGSGLPGWIDLTHALLDHLTQEERQAIGSDTARQLWTLPDLG